MVPRRRDLNSQTALRVLALVLMCGGCKGEIQDAPAVPADHCDVGQHGAGAGWLDGQQLAHHRFDASLLHGHVWKDSTPTPAPARTLASGQGDVPGDKRSGPWRSWDHYGAQPDLRPANQPLEDKWQTVMADVRPGTKPRQPSKKSHTNAADEPKLLDSLTVADGSCNSPCVNFVESVHRCGVCKKSNECRFLRKKDWRAYFRDSE